MRKLFVIYFILSFGYILAQQHNDKTPFSTFYYGVLGGINFGKISEIGGNFHLELKTNLISNFQILFSAGYFNTIEPVNYNVKTHDKISINNDTFYRAISYNVINKNYDVFPISFGFQYLLKNEVLSPYLITNLNYNLINARSEISPGEVWSFNTFEEIPEEFKSKYIAFSPNNFFSVGLGIGTNYNINNKLFLDLRYIFILNKETINTHHLLFGIFL